MAKKKNNVSINALEKYCKSRGNDVVEMTFPIGDDDSITCEVKPRLSLEETMRFIEDVVSASIMEDDLMIVPMAREYVTCKCVLTYYANFTMPQDVNKAYEFVMGATEIIGAILNVIDGHQFQMIQGCIHERIEFEKQKMLSTQVSQIRKLTNEIEHMTEKFSAVFNGVSGEQMTDFITNMSAMAKDSQITPHDLARAVIESKPE